MNVWSICVSISVTVRDIWTKFGTEHKYHTIITPELPNSHNWKYKMAVAAILNFGKMSITLDWIHISRLHQILWENAPRPCGDDHLTKSRNRTLIRETSSMSISVLISVTIADIWKKFIQCSSITLLTWRNVPNLYDLKIQDSGGRNLGFRKMPITPNWIELFAQILVGRCIKAMRRWHMTKTRNRKFFCVTSLLW